MPTSHVELWKLQTVGNLLTVLGEEQHKPIRAVIVPLLIEERYLLSQDLTATMLSRLCKKIGIHAMTKGTTVLLANEEEEGNEENEPASIFAMITEGEVIGFKPAKEELSPEEEALDFLLNLTMLIYPVAEE